MPAATVFVNVQTDAYEDVEKLIWAEVHRERRKTRRPVQELKSIADMVFAECFDKYRRKRSKFTTFLTEKIRYGFLEEKRSRFNRENFAPREDDYPLDKLPDRRPEPFDLASFMRELSKDARTVVRLTLDTPAELTRLLVMADDFSPASFRRHLKKYLFAEYRWRYPRIHQAFNEISLVLP